MQSLLPFSDKLPAIPNILRCNRAMTFYFNYLTWSGNEGSWLDHEHTIMYQWCFVSIAWLDLETNTHGCRAWTDHDLAMKCVLIITYSLGRHSHVQIMMVHNRSCHKKCGIYKFSLSMKWEVQWKHLLWY